MAKKYHILIVIALIVIVVIVYAGSDSDGTDDSSSGDPADGANGGNVNLASIWAEVNGEFENVGASTNSSAAQSSNNPGGLNIGPGNSLYSTLPGVTGAIPAAGPPGTVITTFDTPEDGLNAEVTVLQSYINNHSGLSIIQAVSRYITGNAGSGDPSSYPSQFVARAQAIAAAVGASITSTLGSIAGQ